MNNILFLNHGHSNRCGVYAQGVRHFNALEKSQSYNFIYCEVTSFEEVEKLNNKHKPIAIMYNYMPVVMDWLNYNVKSLKTKNICIIHNITQSIVNTNQFDQGCFDYYISLDKSLVVDNEKLFTLDRPVYEYLATERKLEPKIKIGTFGFPFLHKGFEEVVSAVNEEFDTAEINLHMGESFFCQNETEKILHMCNKNITKSNIKLNFSNHFMEEKDIINFLDQNHINCLFYKNIDGVGVSAAIDYMISAQKPILISTSQQFRNFHKEIPVYPYKNLTYIVNNYNKETENIKSIYNRSLKLHSNTENLLNEILF